MFDPTVYENLKVVLEGAIYDLDFDEEIYITDRKDSVDLATMSRLYRLEFYKLDTKKVTIAFQLNANLKSFSEEILHNNEILGCELVISLVTEIRNVDACQEITNALYRIWEGKSQIEQQLSYKYPNLKQKYQNQITIKFNRNINEEQIEDIPNLLSYALKSAQVVNEIALNGLK